MLKNLQDINEVKFCSKKKYIIFGAGRAGKLLEINLRKKNLDLPYVFCDNNKKLQKEKDIPVLAVDKAVEIDNGIFLVVFCRNNEEKIKSVLKCLRNNNVGNDKIIVIDINSLYGIYIDYISKIIDKNKAKERQRISNVGKIIFLANGFNKETESKKGGGPIGAICMQKKYIGNKIGSVEIEYPYYSDDIEISIEDKYPWITEAIINAREIALKNTKAIYVANDIFSAYGLFLAGANYSIIFHAQGDVVKEITLWGNNVLDGEKEIIYDIENIALKNAHYVYFPSAGAEKYFRNSISMQLDFQTNPPLYNTINDFPTIENIEGIQGKEDFVTFLSIGQMTKLKGMDRVPEFIKRYAEVTGNKVRWIVVADGILKYQIAEDMKRIMENNSNIEYINIDYKISHGQIFYLMQICDAYLMLHRVSVFDFSTLEAMYNALPVILSDIDGNNEFNKLQNIFMVNDNINWDELESYIRKKDINGYMNRQCYKRFFSEKVFREKYSTFLTDFIMRVESEK